MKGLSKVVTAYRAVIEDRRGRILVAALLLGAAMTIWSPPVWAQSSFGNTTAIDPFGGIVDLIDQNLQRWAGALLALGLLGCGASFGLGSVNSGTHARNVLFASFFLLAAAATGGVLGVLAKVRAAAGSGL